MTTFADIVADLIADLEPEAEAATETDPNYGADMSCADDLRPDFGELASDDPLLVAEAAYRRLQTPRGVLDDDADYGLDVRRWLHTPNTQRGLREKEGRAQNEILKDDRVQSVTVTLTPSGRNDVLMTVEGVTATGEFTLTLALTSTEVLLEAIRANP